MEPEDDDFLFGISSRGPPCQVQFSGGTAHFPKPVVTRPFSTNKPSLCIPPERPWGEDPKN